MSNFNNNSILESRHQFIYGFDGEERDRVVQSIVSENPIVGNSTKVGAISVNSDWFKGGEKLDRSFYFAREHFSFNVCGELVKGSLGCDFNDRLVGFLKRVNQILVKGDYKVNSMEELLEFIELGKKFYEEEFEKYVKSGEFQGDFDKLPIQFMDLNFFMRYFKQLINNSSHVAVIINNNAMSSLYKKAVNGMVSSRCNGDISMKVFTDPEKWGSYYTDSGVLVEAVHDYGAIELDNSLHTYVKKLREKRG